MKKSRGRKRAANHKANVRPRSFPCGLGNSLYHHQTSLLSTITSATEQISQPESQLLSKHKQHLTTQQSCLASLAVPPLRPSAPPSLLLSLAQRLSSLLRLARPAPPPSLLPTNTLLLPLLNKLHPQRAAVAVSSARWPAQLRKSPQPSAYLGTSSAQC